MSAHTYATVVCTMPSISLSHIDRANSTGISFWIVRLAVARLKQIIISCRTESNTSTLKNYIQIHHRCVPIYEVNIVSKTLCHICIIHWHRHTRARHNVAGAHIVNATIIQTILTTSAMQYIFESAISLYFSYKYTSTQFYAVFVHVISYYRSVRFVFLADRLFQRQINECG